MSEFLTTTKIAKACGVSFRTVIRWIERGELAAHRLPGRGDYRVAPAELARFRLVHGIPELGAPAASAKTAAEPLRALIAEDDPNMARAIQRVLRVAGFTCEIAENGFQAGTLLHTFRPHLLTLDLRMPFNDGFAVLRYLRDAPPSDLLKVLVISADSRQALDEALAWGAHGALRKPFENAQLVAMLKTLFEPSRVLNSAHYQDQSPG